MLLHNSIYHNELKLSKNHRILRLEDSQMLDYTQSSLFIALDIRHQEVDDFLDLKEWMFQAPLMIMKTFYEKRMIF